jgi:anthranilate synthase component 1
MIRPSLEEAKNLALGCTVVPIALEIFSDQKTPIEILKNIRRQGHSCFMLESVSGSDSWGRYSFLGVAPVSGVYESAGAIVREDGARKTLLSQEPLCALREELAKYKSPRLPDFPPFTGGFVGYFGYDFVRHLIPGLNLGGISDGGFRRFHLMRFDKIIAFDHFRQKISILVNIPTDNIESSYIHGVTQLKDIERLILERSPRDQELSCSCGEFSAHFTQSRFCEMVEQIKSHITEGDIFQAVVSNRFKAPFSGSLLNAYRMLRTINPYGSHAY